MTEKMPAIGATHHESWAAAFRLAKRESRDGLSGFRIFALALILGVFAIAAVGSLSAAFLAGLDKEQRRLLGGDFEITAVDTIFDDEIRNWLEQRGAVSQIINAQLMVRAQKNSNRSVVQLKAVDNAYPLIGALTLIDDTSGAASLDSREIGGQKVWGAVADQSLFNRLSLDPGDIVAIGAAQFILIAPIDQEPDRASAGFLISPRLMISLDAAMATGLIERSGMVGRSLRLSLAPGTENATPQNFKQSLEQAFPNNVWRVRSASDAAGGLERTLTNLEMFLTMVGLSALIIGGVGAANAVHAYMQRKLPVIATLKCLGATGDFIMKTYILQVLFVALLAVLIGLLLGMLTPFAVVGLGGSILPFDAQIGIYPMALARAAMFGILAALVFALWPLARAKQTSPAQLFRSLIETDRGRPARRDMLILAGMALLFLALAIIFSGNYRFAAIFAAGGFGVYLLLRLVAFTLIRLGRKFWHPRNPVTRLAASSLTRPGAATASVIVSIGLGLSLLSMISLIDVNLSREVRSALPDKAPQLFFSDIDFTDREKFISQLIDLAPNAEAEVYYMLRSGVKFLNGQPLSEVDGAERSGWARENDWGVTILPIIPEVLGKITAGERWPADYSGPPLISMSDWQAKRFKLEVGDTITLTIAGRDVTATIQSLHDVSWDRNGLNFIAVFAPGTLEAAKPTSVGSLKFASSTDEAMIVRSLGADFPGITIIRTREVTASIADIIDKIGVVIRALSGVTILAGLVVLLGAVAADFRRKLKDAMIMKAVGASRQRLLSAYALEYAILGLIPAIAALGIGALASWFVVARQMELTWVLSPAVLIAITGGAVAITLAIGLAAAWKALDTRPWPVLRSD